MKKNNYNIVWLFIDGVRRYHSKQEQIDSGDDRSRLEFMDEFAKKSVELYIDKIKNHEKIKSYKTTPHKPAPFECWRCL